MVGNRSFASALAEHEPRTSARFALARLQEGLPGLGDARKDLREPLAVSAEILAEIAVGVQLLGSRCERSLDRGGVRVAGDAEQLVRRSAAIMPIDDRVLRKRQPGLIAGRSGQRRSWAEVRRNLACEYAEAGCGYTNRVTRAFHEQCFDGQPQATRA
jgi:hypothetical protein